MRTSNSVHRPSLYRHNVRYIAHKVSAFPQLKLKEKTKLKKTLSHFPHHGNLKLRTKFLNLYTTPTQQPIKICCSQKITCCVTAAQGVIH